MSSLGKYLFRSFPQFWLGCLFFWCLVVWAACIFWKLIFCHLFLYYYFPHSEGCLCTLHIVFFAVQKLLGLIKSHMFTFVLISITQELDHRGSCFDLCHWVFCLCFPLRHLQFLALCLGSLIHFEFVFVNGVRKCSNFILLHVVVQFSQHHLLKRLSLLHCIFFPPLSKIRYL